MKKNIMLLMGCGVEFVAAVLVALFIGLKLDDFFNSYPLFMIVFIVLGSAAGYLNILRYLKKR